MKWWPTLPWAYAAREVRVLGKQLRQCLLITGPQQGADRLHEREDSREEWVVLSVCRRSQVDNALQWEEIVKSHQMAARPFGGGLLWLDAEGKPARWDASQC